MNNTRMSIWKEYRDQISKNADLQKDIQVSNEKVNVLHKRILEVMPDYDEEFKLKIKTIKPDLEEFSSLHKISSKNLNELFDKLNEIQELPSNYDSIDKIDFSSHELDDLLTDIKKRNHKQQYNDYKAQPTVTIRKQKKIFFDKELNMKKTFSVAIDGPSGSGKSTVARLLAEKYGLNYINTGLVYRSVALNAKEHGIEYSDERSVVESLKSIKIKLLNNEVVYLNEINVTKQLRDNDISQGASKVSVYKDVRRWAVELQQGYGAKGGVIMDGRDTTFKVLPKAEVKIYLDTTPEERANRRAHQNKELGFDYDYDTLLKEIRIRDERDMNRKEDPLHRTEDAHYIDATDLSIRQVVEAISEIIQGVVYNE